MNLNNLTIKKAKKIQTPVNIERIIFFFDLIIKKVTTDDIPIIIKDWYPNLNMVLARKC